MSREEEDRLHEYRFNWYVKNILPYYKQEVCRVHNISSEEYDRRTLNADESIYLPQPNPKFESTWYSERVAHVLGLDYKGFQDKVRKGELEDKIATGGFGSGVMKTQMRYFRGCNGDVVVVAHFKELLEYNESMDYP